MSPEDKNSYGSRSGSASDNDDKEQPTNDLEEHELSTEEVEELYTKWSDLRQFILERRIKDKTTSPLPITHTVDHKLNIHIKASERDAFDRLLARDIKRGVRLYFNELIQEKFRLFSDWDCYYERPIDCTIAIEYARLYQKCIAAFYGKSYAAIILASPPYETKDGRYRYGFHIIIPKLLVTSVQALYVRQYALRMFEQKFPLRDAKENAWTDRFDRDVYRLNCGGLRLYGNHKLVDCQACKPKKGEYCLDCNNTRKIDEGRPYDIYKILDEDGHIQEEAARDMRQDEYKAAKYTRLHLSGDLPGNFCKPSDCPEPGEYITKPRRPKNMTDRQYADYVEMHRFAGDAKGLSQFQKKTPVSADSDMWRLVREHICGIRDEAGEITEAGKFHPNYHNLRILSMYMPNRSTVIIATDSSFCMNKGDNHTSNRVWFQLSGSTLTQRCFSNKDISYKQGTCREFKYSVGISPELLQCLQGCSKKKRKQAINLPPASNSLVKFGFKLARKWGMSMPDDELHTVLKHITTVWRKDCRKLGISINVTVRE